MAGLPKSFLCPCPKPACFSSVYPSFQELIIIFHMSLVLQMEQGHPSSSHSVCGFPVISFFLSSWRLQSHSLGIKSPCLWPVWSWEVCALYCPITCQGTCFAKVHFKKTYFGIMHLRFTWHFLNYSFIVVLLAVSHSLFSSIIFPTRQYLEI